MTLGLRTLQIALCGSLSIAGCASIPVEAPKPPTERLTYLGCDQPLFGLHFDEGQASLRSPTNRSLSDYAYGAERCGEVKASVKGLPSPDMPGLAGQRAATVARVVEALGWPTPSFELGAAEQIEKPVLIFEKVTAPKTDD